MYFKLLFFWLSYSDVDFIYDQLKENHPGMYLDSDFVEILNNSYAQATVGGDINKFIKQFDDPHLRIEHTPKTKIQNNPNKTKYFF